MPLFDPGANRIAGPGDRLPQDAVADAAVWPCDTAVLFNLDRT